MRALLLALLLAAPAAAGESPESPPAAAPPPAPAPGPEIVLRPLEDGAWVVTQLRPWPSHALLVEMGESDLVLVDTLYTPAAMRELLAWIDKRRPGRRLLAVNTHFHSDRTGGNAFLKERKVPIYASTDTVRLMKRRGRAVMEGVARAIQDDAAREAFLSAPVSPADGTFSPSTGLKLTLGGDPLEIRFPGAGHSPDNVVVWFPRRRILFAGALALPGDRLGNVSDADLGAWPASLAALSAYPARWVIPAYGASFEPGLLSRTAETLEKRAAR